jgi:hypothetical protein
VHIGNRLFRAGMLCNLCVQKDSATSYHQYLYNDPKTPYSRILQYGVDIKITSRTPAQNAELSSFVTFLTSNTTALNYIKSACYSLK